MMYLKLAWRNIWRNKRRSLIAMASVLFAVVIALAMRSMQLGSYRHMIRNTVGFQTGYAQIHGQDYWDSRSINDSFALTDSLVRQTGRIRHITMTTPRLETFTLVSSGEITDGAMVTGIAPVEEDRFTGLKSRLVRGRYLEPRDSGILLAKGLAEHLQVSVEDTVVLLGQGYHGITAAGKYPVAGLLEYPMPELNNRLAYLSLSESQRLIGAPGRATALAIMIDRQDRLEPVMAELEDRFGQKYEVMSWEQMLPEVVQSIEADNASGLIMLLIIYMVIGFGILGTVLMMTMERTREFGMMVAIGMKRGRLRLVAILESLMLTFVGVLTGVLLGVPVLLYLHDHPIQLRGQLREMMVSYGWDPVLPFSLDPMIFVWQALIVLIIALAAATYPVWRISRVDPVEALRTG
jgi:ABC-type lipoprotein release transport system permease subunit